MSHFSSQILFFFYTIEQLSKAIKRVRYKEERTLVRGLRRLPGESRADFHQKVRRLKEHFEQFNLDTSEICQWLMGLRPGGTRRFDGSGALWRFLLEPKTLIQSAEGSEIDHIRRTVLDTINGIAPLGSLEDSKLPTDIVEHIKLAAGLEYPATTVKFFSRLSLKSPAHRQVLYKASAEWIVSRYLRGYENYERQWVEWEKEKALWEKTHPELTADIANEFTDIFKEMKIRRKNPRICSWERLSKNQDDCEYAGERIGDVNHSQLCKKFKQFIDSNRSVKNVNKHFTKNAEIYLEILKKYPRTIFNERIEKLLKRVPNARGWFSKKWNEYLTALGIKEDTLLKQGGLPHCTAFSDDSACTFNKHTNDCTQYKLLLEKKPHLHPHESLYRQWRKLYLAGPSKPSFQYPSTRHLPMPKIFGRDFYNVDFDKSVLNLRLDDMPEGEFMSFGFHPWPPDYNLQPAQIEVTSAHINFSGTKAKAAFRFSVKHEESLFEITQEDLEELRSRKYPRRYQDAAFLEEARGLLLKSFKGDETKLRCLAVDMGERGASAAVFNGLVFNTALPLKIIKLEKLYNEAPKPEKKSKKDKKENTKEEAKREKQKGLNKQHVGWHLEGWAEGAKAIALKRKVEGLGDHDMRRLMLHIKWMIRDWVRLNASQIIKAAEDNKVNLIVFESLRGFRAPGYDVLNEEKKRRMAFFAYGAVRRKVTEKAVERGMRVVTTPYNGSSQVCSECGRRLEDRKRWEKNKRGGKFVCEFKECGYEDNSDNNAAKVIGKVFWGEIQLPEVEPGA